MKKLKKYENLHKQKFMLLQPLYCLDHKENSGSVWVCKCDCGKYTHATGAELLGPYKKSCGCTNKPKGTQFNFEKYFEMKSPFECWEWSGVRHYKGYGEFTYREDGIRYKNKAHRLSYMFYVDNTELKTEDFICHTCDNPCCVNPEHLFKGDNQSNVNDKMEKGRHNVPKGEQHWASKLKLADVKVIKELIKSGEKTSVIAKQFNVNSSTIRGIKAGRTWREA